MFKGDTVDTRDPQNAPFRSLHVRLRPLVLDGIPVNELDMTKTGTALDPAQWHEVVKAKSGNSYLVLCLICLQRKKKISRFWTVETSTNRKWDFSMELIDFQLQNIWIVSMKSTNTWNSSTRTRKS